VAEAVHQAVKVAMTVAVMVAAAAILLNSSEQRTDSVARTTRVQLNGHQDINANGSVRT